MASMMGTCPSMVVWLCKLIMLLLHVLFAVVGINILLLLLLLKTDVGFLRFRVKIVEKYFNGRFFH